jgi:YVTN family beta-propeller protein
MRSAWIGRLRLVGVPLAEGCERGTDCALAEGTTTFTPERGRRSNRRWRCGFGVALTVALVLAFTGSAWAATAWVYVTNLESNTVTPIEVATNKPGPEIKVGSGPDGIAITPDGKTAYVTNSVGNTVTPFNVGTHETHPAIAVGSTPVGIAVTRIFQMPTVTKVSATSGPVTGDMVVTITGTNLGVAGAVEFGGVPASAYFVNGAGTEIAALSPAREVAGTVDVTVRTPGGTSKTTTKDHYKYLPVITSIRPNRGPAGVEQQVEIFGAGFKSGASEILFGTTLVGNAGCFGPTFCAAVSPALPKGKVEVKVKVNGLTSIKTKAALYTYF